MYRANKAEPTPKASGNVVEHHTYSPRLSQYFVSKRDPATTRCSQHVARDRPSAAFMPVLHKRNYVRTFRRSMAQCAAALSGKSLTINENNICFSKLFYQAGDHASLRSIVARARAAAVTLTARSCVGSPSKAHHSRPHGLMLHCQGTSRDTCSQHSCSRRVQTSTYTC